MPVTLTGPPHHPDAPLGFCAICSAAWKAAAFATQGKAAGAADKAPEHTTMRLAPEPPVPWPAPAVTCALVILPLPPGIPGTGQPTVVPLPVCWTHVNAVSFTGSGIVLAANGMPPAFGGGIPLDRPH